MLVFLCLEVICIFLLFLKDSFADNISLDWQYSPQVLWDILAPPGTQCCKELAASLVAALFCVICLFSPGTQHSVSLFFCRFTITLQMWVSFDLACWDSLGLLNVRIYVWKILSWHLLECDLSCTLYYLFLEYSLHKDEACTFSLLCPFIFLWFFISLAFLAAFCVTSDLSFSSWIIF